MIPQAVLLAVVLSVSASRAAPARPNVLFIIADDLNVEGVKGLSQVHTPNLDRLAARGITFGNAHCAVPLCGPSRACLLAGLHAHHTGWFGWGQNKAAMKGWREWRERPVIRDATMWTQHFARNGYRVYGTGKIAHAYHKDAWLFDNDGGTNGYAFSPVTQGPGPSDGPDPAVLKRSGRTLYHPAGTPEYTPEPMKQVGRWFAPLSRVPDIPPDPGTGAPGYRGWIEFGQPFRYESEDDRDLMTDEKSARFAVDVLGRKHDTPFLLAVGFCKPHEPLIAPKKYFDLLAGVDVQMPPYRAGDLADCADVLHGGTMNERVFAALRQSGEGYWKEYVRAYLACVAFIDDQIGQILDALERSPYAGNTLVVFTSDNGFHLGEKDMCEKNTAWNESTHVPLVIRAPGMKSGGLACAHPVSLVDLYPTFIDYCGLPGNPHAGGCGLPLDGRSLRPLLEDPAHGPWDGPAAALTGVMGKPTAQQRGDCTVPAEAKDQHFTVCSERHRYILAAGGGEELYDHEKDPHEWTNLADHPEFAAVKADLRNLLLKMTRRE